MTVRVAINGFDRIDYLRPVAEFGCAEIATVAMSDLNSVVSNAHLMVYAAKSDKSRRRTQSPGQERSGCFKGFSLPSSVSGLQKLNRLFL